ncbi:hypothetical protein CAPTEDRAFT_210198 [Capitella teleta]|uniref:Major facilitator superfamily (MFS) profile domain-containing protein n=1 Tax=Capitella teleta TaxID=283909 RepID=R7U2D5_CAPTE|nr:hypothetical protein CAPTEDRAFT_210198 [Capitella teleta]|eukprot:ELT97796.1 hypothetical protein CAPTEDRAFT_210198 [Capitella teleta]
MSFLSHILTFSLEMLGIGIENMQQSTAPPLHPIDHGWAWMICFGEVDLKRTGEPGGASVANFFVNGGMRSMGILLVELMVRFQAPGSITAIAVGLIAAGFAIFAALGNGWGFVLTNRVVNLAGAVFLVTGTLIAAFAPNIVVVIIFWGLFSGIGYGFLFGPAMVTVGQYFEKRRSLANGLAVAGGSVGQLVLPLFLSYILNEYGYEGAMLIYAGVCLNVIPGVMLLRPPSFYNRGKKAVQQRRELAAKEAEEKKLQNNNLASISEKDLEDGESHADKRAMYGSTKSLDHAPMQEPTVDEDDIASVTDGETQTPVQRPSIGQICCIILQKLFSKELLTNLSFLAISMGVALGHGGYLDILFLVPAYCIELFDSKTIGPMILSVMGIADLGGRIFGGWFSDLGLVSRTSIVGFSFVMSGTLSLLLPFFPSFGVLMAYSVVFGLMGGTYMALLAVIVVDLFGLPMLATSMGLSTMIMGLSMIPMPTIMGMIMAAAGTTSVPIRVCGVMLLVGGILYYLVPLTKAIETRKAAKKARKNVVYVDVECQVKPSDFFSEHESKRLSLASHESHI